MGVHRVKEHFGIHHTVHMEDGKLLIGSDYIRDILIFSVDGELLQGRQNFDEYVKEIAGDRESFKTLLALPDDETGTVSVFSHNNGRVIEQKTYALGWPHVTLCGERMYNNTHFASPQEAAQHGVESMAYRVQHDREQESRLREQLKECQDRKKESQLAIQTLMSAFSGLNIPVEEGIKSPLED